jgi:hypothetical protein
MATLKQSTAFRLKVALKSSNASKDPVILPRTEGYFLPHNLTSNCTINSSIHAQLRPPRLQMIKLVSNPISRNTYIHFFMCSRTDIGVESLDQIGAQSPESTNKRHLQQDSLPEPKRCMDRLSTETSFNLSTMTSPFDSTLVEHITIFDLCRLVEDTRKWLILSYK